MTEARGPVPPFPWGVVVRGVVGVLIMFAGALWLEAHGCSR